MFIQHIKDILTYVFQFVLNLISVCSDHSQFVIATLVLFLLLDAGYYSPAGPTSSWIYKQLYFVITYFSQDYKTASTISRLNALIKNAFFIKYSWN